MSDGCPDVSRVSVGHGKASQGLSDEWKAAAGRFPLCWAYPQLTVAEAHALHAHWRRQMVAARLEALHLEPEVVAVCLRSREAFRRAGLPFGMANFPVLQQERNDCNVRFSCCVPGGKAAGLRNGLWSARRTPPEKRGAAGEAVELWLGANPPQ